jgi:hypothetical protein
MRAKSMAALMAALGATAVVMVASGDALAQEQTARSLHRRHPIPRITVVPLSHYYRQCDFWLAVEHRPSGDVITPQQHCWWALR